jgi:hypothetical protein
LFLTTVSFTNKSLAKSIKLQQIEKQVSNMNEHKIVQASLQEIFKLNGYSDSELMTQRDYEHVGSEIEKKSGILISSTTIKRLSNGAFSRSPQIATLNAIANYFDFKTWQEYKSSLNQKPDGPAESESRNSPEKKRKVPAFFKWILLSTIPLVIFGYYVYQEKTPNKSFEKASFFAHKTTSNEIPNTVVFNYDIDDVSADSFFIQQSWDKNRRVRIYKNKHTLTDIYYEPGYHIAKLIANDSIIKTMDVHIPTDRWFFYANENRFRYATEYIKIEKFIKDGSMVITKEELIENKIFTDQEKIFLYSYFPSKLQVSSDNFYLKTRVRMKEVRNNLCPYIAFEVYCQRNFMLMKSTPKGCANRALLWFGEKDINGKETDLAPIAFDVTQWTDVELLVRDKHVTININGKKVFSTSYQSTSQLITGLSFISNGLCEVDYVELTSLNGTIVCKDNFGSK